MSRIHEALWGAGLIFLICIFSFGLQIPALGFYWDDYASMYVYFQEGEQGLIDLFSGQARSISGYLGAAVWNIAGTNPAGWHALNFFLYTVSVLIFWRILRLLWPEYKTQTLLIALLFAVYPSYQLRPVPVSLYLIAPLVLFLLSFWLSLIAAKNRSIGLSIVAALLIPVYQMMYEQNLGYELLRPLAMLWMLLKGTSFSVTQWKQYTRRLISVWFPYPLAVMSFLFYRFVLFEPDSTYATYNQFQVNNLDNILLVFKRSFVAPIRMVLIDWFEVPWRIFVIEKVDADIPGMLATLFTIAAVLYLWKYQDLQRIKSASMIALLGGVTIAALLLPAHAVGRSLEIGLNSRWALTPTPLAALIVGLMLPRLIRPVALGQMLLLALVIAGLAVQVGVNKIYEADYELRRDLMSQLRWRAPQLEADTMLALVLPENAFAFGRRISDYEITGLSNLYYDGDKYPYIAGAEARMVIFVLSRPDIQDGNWAVLTSGRNVTFRNWNFDIETLLVVAYDGGCLHFADEKVHFQSINSDIFNYLAPYSQSERILVERQSAGEIQDEPEHGWCFYYQQIQRALQSDNIEQAVWFADEARLYFTPLPGHEIEWLPFIETYNRAGRYREAEIYLPRIAVSGEYNQKILCERLNIQLADQPDILATQRKLIPLCSS